LKLLNVFTMTFIEFEVQIAKTKSICTYISQYDE
jgi:hypothetical protein